MSHLELAKKIEERYRSYLKSTFYFRDPKLRASFEAELNSGHLRKGPYLEATPVFKRMATPRNVFHDLLGVKPDEKFLNAIDGDRRLYLHQEKAIRKVFQGQNVIVTTGTGSGKTEAFLYPILLHLYKEFQEGKLCPGVRALILYPMNALANDQRMRLGEISERLQTENSPFRFTFGQYIGETPKDETDTYRHASDHIANRKPGELVLRSEMWKTPPHVLLTNYSMLEYLLLRPDDSPLLDSGRAFWWTYFVLDEAHQYRGSRGIEMAMLLRRLKQRLIEGGRSQPFRCIATSATLVGEKGDRLAVAKFACGLFGEEFHQDNVILGETEPIPNPGSKSLEIADYKLLKQALNGHALETKNHVVDLMVKFGLSQLPNEDLFAMVARLLQCDDRTTTLRRLIENNPLEVEEIAGKVFSNVDDEVKRMSALSDMVELLLQAKNPDSEAPILSTRYHLFLRALEGAYVSYWPEKRVYLGHKPGGEGETALEIALCRECGQHYFVGPKDFKGGKLTEAIRDPSHSKFGATFFLPLENGLSESDDNESKDTNNKQVFQLCVQCGEMGKDNPNCTHENLISVEKVDSKEDEDRADQLKECAVCGYNASGKDPVREMVHGNDGPNAVIATTLYQNLPLLRRKILAFADGRQEAAFFAWYLQESYKDIVERNLILKVVRSSTPLVTEGFSLRDMAMGLRDIFKKQGIPRLSASDLELRRKAWTALYREFLTDELRLSLQGVGLVRWSIDFPHWIHATDCFMREPWFLTEKEARDLLCVLLDFMKLDKALELRTEEGVALAWDDLGLQGIQTGVVLSEKSKSKYGEMKWSGENGRRARFLAKLLRKINGSLSEENAKRYAVDALRSLWEGLRRSDENAPSSSDCLLLSIGDARRLNPEWWRLHTNREYDVIFRCDTCSRLQSVSVRGVCLRHRCPGKLEQVVMRNIGPNHYRTLYQEDLPGSLRVEEHTAQIDKEIARQFQEDFRKGNIHVLSCSTTFELGVDLGDLDTIFLRNVPPEAFNYAQRVGRSGRRSGRPGFAITYCRRGSHDLYHFYEPQRMLSGKVRAPVLSLRNEKIIVRHIAAAALSTYFRKFPTRFKTVESFLVDMTSPSGVADFKIFLSDHRADLESALRTIVPSDMHTQVGLDNSRWMEKIAGGESGISIAEAEVSSDYRAVEDFKVFAASKEDWDSAKWASERANEIVSEVVLTFLSRKAVIPKYGFPVDVVELDTQRTRQRGQSSFQILLQRDLSIAISEFAPTSKLIANKKVWASYGLKKVAGKEWPRKRYMKCSKHNLFSRWQRGEEDPQSPCGCSLEPYEYIIPRFGFVTNREGPKDPTARTARVFSTRPYFVDSIGPAPDDIYFPAQSPLIVMKKASPGLMAVLCEGRRENGFYICGGCGAGFRTSKDARKHRTPYGQDCNGAADQVSLGHEFPTDVLQIQFKLMLEEEIEPIWFAFSLAYALVEAAAEILEVPSTDLSTTVAYSGQGVIPSIILYDNVPGGAGLVARLEKEEMLRACLEAAQKRVSGICDCDEKTSCYGCLRSFRNQFAHPHLQRGSVMRYLKSLNEKWISPTLEPHLLRR